MSQGKYIGTAHSTGPMHPDTTTAAAVLEKLELAFGAVSEKLEKARVRTASDCDNYAPIFFFFSLRVDSQRHRADGRIIFALLLL